MGYRVILFMTMFSVLLANMAFPQDSHQQAPATNTVFASTQTRAPSPLPYGCGGVTPPTEEEAACCLSGTVYFDGEVIDGAEVIISNKRGNQKSETTRMFLDSEVPGYRLSLSAPPLNVQSGDTIEITARHGDHTQTLEYTVRSGSQQVDIVIPSEQGNDYDIGQRLWFQDDAKDVAAPRDITLGSNGQLYVVDGVNLRVQSFTSNGQNVVVQGTRGSEKGQFLDPRAITTDSDGNVYVLDTGNGQIHTFDSILTPVTSWGGFRASNGFAGAPYRDYRGLAVDTDGSMYVAMVEGKPTTRSVILKYDSEGNQVDVWEEGDLRDPRDIAINAEGHILVADDDRIVTFKNNGRPPTTIPIDHEIRRLAVDPAGDIYVAASDDSIHKYKSYGTLIDTWEGSEVAQLWQVQGIAANADNIYIADWQLGPISSFNTEGAFSQSWGKRTGQSDRFNGPTDVAIDSENNVYVVEKEHARVQKFNSEGKIVTSWGTYGSGNREFKEPHGIAIDAFDNVYVADTGNHRIQKFAPNGELRDVWHNQGFYNPTEIAIASNGAIYVADGGNNAIKVRTADSETFLPWENDYFDRLSDVAVDSDGMVYVLDDQANQITRFSTSGNVIAVWDVASKLAHELPEFATRGIDIDSSDRVYVTVQSQDGLHAIYKFDKNGDVLTNLGQTELRSPHGITLDQSGNVYVTDMQTHSVAIFHPTTANQPVATINHINKRTFAPGDQLRAYGMGQDSDATPNDIQEYEWRSDKDGVLGTEPALTVPINRLQPGTHQLQFRVRDGEGQWSESTSIRITNTAVSQTEWTMLLYLAGDYDDGGSLYNTFDEMVDRLGESFRNTEVRIVAQIDGPQDNDTFRVTVTPGSGSQPATVERLRYSEQAMDSPETLVQFIQWGQQIFPANHYYLSVANHGQAIQGIAWDRTSASDGSAYLTSKELREALGADGVVPVDIVHLDACSLNLFEVAYELRERSEVVIASQYLAWDFFAYDQYVNAFTSETTAQAASQTIVEMYAALAREHAVPFTISAMDVRRVEPTAQAIDDLATKLRTHINNEQIDPEQMSVVWQNTRKFESNGDWINNDEDWYIDLVHWTEQMGQAHFPANVIQSAQELQTELTLSQQPFVIANAVASGSFPLHIDKNGTYVDLSNSYGVSIFFPGKSERRTFAYDGYKKNELFGFTESTSWTSFLEVGLGVLPPGGPLDGEPNPLAPLPQPESEPEPGATQIFLPMIQR
ncbi:MAG: clostripain-related cysteine peptidase [Chloroflexota bacterium]